MILDFKSSLLYPRKSNVFAGSSFSQAGAGGAAPPPGVVSSPADARLGYFDVFLPPNPSLGGT